MNLFRYHGSLRSLCISFISAVFTYIIYEIIPDSILQVAASCVIQNLIHIQGKVAPNVNSKTDPTRAGIGRGKRYCRRMKNMSGVSRKLEPHRVARSSGNRTNRYRNVKIDGGLIWRGSDDVCIRN